MGADADDAKGTPSAAFPFSGGDVMNVNVLFAMSGLLVLSACNWTNSDNPTTDYRTVKVVDEQGRGIANAAVVIGNQTGELVSYLTTNKVGEAYVGSPPENATVTAAYSCYSPDTNRTYYLTDTIYSANVAGVTLVLGTCEQGSQDVNIHVTTTAGIASSDITLGAVTYAGTDAAINVNGAVQDDGRISPFATGYDDAGAIKGYGFAADRPAIDGSTIDVVTDRTDIVQHTHTFANVPSNALSYYAFASLMRKHAFTNLPYHFFNDTVPLPASITTYSAGSFSDNNMLGAAIALDHDGDGMSDADVGLMRFMPNVAAQVFDFGSTPAVPGGLAYSPSTTGRPMISWSNSNPGATVQKVTFSYTSNAPKRVAFSYSITVPASATSLAYPELPELLAAFRPSAYSNLSLEAMKFDGSTSYYDYLNAVAKHNGWFYEAAGLSNYGYARISRQP